MNLIFTLIAGSFFLVWGGCQNVEKQVHSTFLGTAHYSMELPYMIELPSELDEVSGIAYYPADSSIFAVMDEYGLLYKINIRDDKTLIAKWKFGGMNDYEELVMVDSTFYVLVSTGEVLQIKFGEADSIYVNHFPFPESGNEFEAMYWDPNDKVLRLICKDCEVDNKKVLSTYTFNPQEQVFAPSFQIDVSTIAYEINKSKMKFKPSAAAYHEGRNEVYLISSINKVLVICTPDGKVKEAIAIDPSMFKQPEGISFTDGSTLIISNEAADVGSANILFFKEKNLATSP